MSPRLIPAPPGLFSGPPGGFYAPADYPARPKRNAHQRARAKGQRIEAMAKRALEALGYLVETAPQVLQRIPDPTADGGVRIMSRRHDLFGVWDLVAVHIGLGTVRFVQVTTHHLVSDRRRKILASKFPKREGDLIVGYLDGQRAFSVWRGPTFADQVALHLIVPPDPKPRRRK